MAILSIAILSIAITVCLFLLAFGVSSQNTTNDSSKCYERLGCLQLGPPWKTAKRPVADPGSIEEIGAHFALYGRYLHGGVDVNQWPEISVGEEIDFTLPITVITHGFIASGESDWINELKDVYLEKKNVNVLVASWEKGSAPPNYLLATSNTRVVAREICRVLRYFKSQGTNLTLTHCIGHSLGAHICGYVAKELKAEGIIIEEVTGLDPAQPGFETADDSVRLTKGDAQFVVALHTNAAPIFPFIGFGIMKPIGDVDFYFNTQVKQPGCFTSSAMDAAQILGDIDWTDLHQIPWAYVAERSACSHGRASAYYIEAIKGPSIFWGQPLTDAQKLITRLPVLANLMPFKGNCTMETCTPVGFATRHFSYRGAAFVRTNGLSPFCNSKRAEEMWGDEQFSKASDYANQF